MGRRETNTAVFQDIVAMVDGSGALRAAVAETTRKQQLILASQDIPEPSAARAQDAKIVVSSKRTLEAAAAYKGKTTCVLNFASATNPGGGVLNGSSAQEESLCRCSTLYFCLNTPELMHGFYRPHREAKNPLYNDDLLYSPDVYVIKTDTASPARMSESDWYKINVVTCAAPNLRNRPSNAMNSLLACSMSQGRFTYTNKSSAVTTA